MKRYNLFNQGIQFFLISGLGWLMDVSLYLVLAYAFNKNVAVANGISAIPAVTFVFFTSTKKTFRRKDSKVSLGQKYVIYFLYQVILLLGVSMLNQYIYDFILKIGTKDLPMILQYAKTISKLIITPVTMTINFVVMKLLIEKI